MARPPITAKGEGLFRQQLNAALDYVESLGGGGISDGDKGDIVVSGSGTVWTVESTVISGAIAATPLNDLAAPDGSVNFAQQQAVSFVIENRTSDPGSPVAGQLWLRTDL